MPSDNRLSYVDQALFLAVRATGQEPVMQCVWVYERGVDLDGLTQFHRNLGYGLIGRRIERSPLPFARHRWVASIGQPADIDVAPERRPRAQLTDWADERVRLPVDPEYGPGWRLSVATFDDGSSGVSLVASHCLVDGVGGMLTVVNAAMGVKPDFGYPAPGSRTRRAAAAGDAWQTLKEGADVGRAIATLARMAVHREPGDAQARPAPARSVPAAPRPRRGADDPGVVVPAVSVYVDGADWDARADDLGGTSYALMAGIGAVMGERMGRARPDSGIVTLLIPTNDRQIGGEHDTRANAVNMAKVQLDPAPVTKDLTGARAAIRQALKTARDTPDPALLALPLTPFVPKWGIKKMADMLLGFGDLPVSCSNVGDVPEALCLADGTQADRVFVRGLDRHIPRSILDRVGGQLTLVGGRIKGTMTISVVAFAGGSVETKPQLRALAQDVLSEFGLSGSVE